MSMTRGMSNTEIIVAIIVAMTIISVLLNVMVWILGSTEPGWIYVAGVGLGIVVGTVCVSVPQLVQRKREEDVR